MRRSLGSLAAEPCQRVRVLPVKTGSVPNIKRMTLARCDSCRCQKHVQQIKNSYRLNDNCFSQSDLIQVGCGQGWRLNRFCCFVSELVASSDLHPRLPITRTATSKTSTIHPPYIGRTPLQEPEMTHLAHTHAMHKLQLRSCSIQHCTQPTPPHWQGHHAIS